VAFENDSAYLSEEFDEKSEQNITGRPDILHTCYKITNDSLGRNPGRTLFGSGVQSCVDCRCQGCEQGRFERYRKLCCMGPHRSGSPEKAVNHVCIVY
jgi:hypothetical protein